MLLNYQQKQTSLNESDQKIENIFVIHGLFGSLSNLANVANSLQTNYKITCVDLRNHGDSPHSDSMSYQEMSNDIFELADHLSIDNFSIIGHSMGGKVAMYCALQRPDRINKLVIVDIAPVKYGNHHQNVFDGLTTLIEKPIESRQTADKCLSVTIEDMGIRQFLLKSLFRKEGKFQLKFNLNGIMKNYTLISDWPNIDAIFNKPILFIKGADSDYILEKYSTSISRLFPKAQAKIISHTGHWVHADKPKMFNRLVMNFFSHLPS
jgi:esterase